jgi:hypothetical protein
MGTFWESTFRGLTSLAARKSLANITKSDWLAKPFSFTIK